MRPRKQLTIGELIEWLEEKPKDSLLFCAPSEVNLDEPIMTQEFIVEEARKPCVVVESTTGQITFGYVE